MKKQYGLAYPRRSLFLSLALAAAIAAGSAVVSGIPAPALSLGWYEHPACDDAEAANPGAPGCRYDGRETLCDDAVDNDSDEKTDCLDSDCPTCPTACPKTERDSDGDCERDEQGFFNIYAHACANSTDDDGNLATDCSDPDCADYVSCRPEICRNGLDDDGDGRTDCSDDGCATQGECWACINNPSPENCDPICVGTTEICGNGIDEDCDGSDFPCGGPICGNLRCESGESCSSCSRDCGGCRATEVCDDRADNDADSLVDCDDADCATSPACAGLREDCANSLDDDGDGAIDCGDTDCAPEPRCRPETACDDAVDNDSDGATDCSDSDCASNPACVECDVCEIDGGCYDLCGCDMTHPSCGSGGCSNLCDNATCAGYDACECLGGDACVPKTETSCIDAVDNDSDGDVDCDDGDCASDSSCHICDQVDSCRYGQRGSCEACCDDDGDGFDDTTQVPCEAPKSCVVLVVEGINSSGSFYGKIAGMPKSLDVRASIENMGSTNDPTAQGAEVESRLAALYANSNQDERILVAAHSLGAIAVHNMKRTYGGGYPDTSFMLYDAPYNYPGSGAPWSLLSNVLTAIRAARNSGIAGTLSADWTGGYDEPGKDAAHSTNSFGIAEDAAHNRFDTDVSVLGGVKTWLSSCPAE